MNSLLRASLLCSLLAVVGCKTTGGARPPPGEPAFESTVAPCDDAQKAIAQAADTRASPYGIDQHVAKNFPDRKVSWLMTDSAYQKFIVQTGAKHFGRCNDNGCFLFAAPAATIQDAVAKSMVDGKHDPAVIGKALGLPAANFEGTLRMMTLDLAASKSCARLPVDEDPGVWKCQTPEDTDCFKFGGYTSGGIPEIMVVNAPVDQATVAEVP
jgi:hypothetical protein